MAISNYRTPQVTVQQEFAVAAQSNVLQLPACIVGPRYRVFDYNDPVDKPGLAYGAYDSTTDTTYSLNGFPAVSVLDATSVQVYFEGVWARYAQVTAGAIIERGTTANTIKWIGSGDGFQSVGAYNRSSIFVNRDVQIGDRLRVANLAESIIKETRVTGFIRDTIAEVIPATATNAGTNKPTQVASQAVLAVDVQGTDHAISSVAGYTGSLALGITSDVYTLECIVGGAPLTAKFKVTSASGKDNVASVTTVAFGSPMAVGTLGANATFTSAGTQDFVVGEVYTVSPFAPFTQSIPSTTSSSYSGPIDTVYYIDVVSGGTFASGPQIAVSTSNGVDYQAPQTVAFNTTVSIGNLGMKLIFDDVVPQSGLCLGDRYTIAVTARTQGPVKTIVLADALSSLIAAGDDLHVDFHIYKSTINIPALAYPTLSDVNWELPSTGTEIEIKSGIDIVDSTWTNVLLLPEPIPVVKASIYVGYKTLVTSEANTIGSISELSLVEAVLGKVVPENPLAYGVYKALQNSGGTAVYYASITSDNLAGYTDVLSALEQTDSIYNIVGLSNDASVRGLLRSHVISQSGETQGQERVLLTSVPLESTVFLYDLQSDGVTGWTATVSVDPGNAGQYTYVNIPGATLLTSGVRPGDVLRINFGVDAYGNVTYSSYTILSVTDETNLVLVNPALPAAIVLPTQVKIVRTLTKDEQAAAVATASGTLFSSRVINIWPDLPKSDDGKIVAGYFLAAAIAGLRSSVVPQQGLTNVTVSGFASMDRSAKYFTPTQLNTIAAGGTWIVVQDPDGVIFTRHQLTTDTTDEFRQEASIQSNLDAIAKSMRIQFKPYVGKYNINDGFLGTLDNSARHKLESLKSDTITTQAGPQLVDYRDLSITQDALIRTKVRIKVSVLLPFPANYIELTLLAI